MGYGNLREGLPRAFSVSKLSPVLFLSLRHGEEKTPADPSKRGQDALIPEASALCRDRMHSSLPQLPHASPGFKAAEGKTNHEYFF